MGRESGKLPDFGVAADLLRAMGGQILPFAGAARKRKDGFDRGEAKFKALVEQIPAVTFIAWLDGGLNEVYVSPQIEQLLGYTAREWLENPILWYSALHPDDRERWNVEFAETISKGEPFRSVYRFHAKDGRVVWIHGEARIVRNDSGVPIFVQGIGFDVTEVKRAELSLRELNEELETRVRKRTVELERSEDRFRNAIVSAPVSMVIVDDQGTIAMVNERFCEVLGYEKPDIEGREVECLLPERLRAGHPSQRRSYLADPTPRPMGQARDLFAQKADGTEIPVEIALSPVESQGKTFVLATLIDLSIRKEAERAMREAREAAEDASRAKGDFLANMSHEIRTPMNAVIGMTDLLLDTELDATQEDFARTIQSSGEHLLTLINDILDFSKIEAGKMTVEKHPFELRGCVEDALELMASKAAEKGLDLVYYVADGVPGSVLSDAGRLRQILVNLVSNAVKFTERGGVSVEVDGRRKADGRWRLEFVVRDTGIGIAPDKLAGLFDAFTQADSSTTRLYGGTGLGLAISRRLVELLGGTIRVESRVGEGSVFRFSLVARAAARPVGVSLAGTQRRLAGRAVFYVDDFEMNRVVVERLGLRWGLAVRTAPSAGEALEILKSDQAFDLILLDHQMPEMDGVELARRIVDLPHRASTPLALYTSLGSFSSDEAGDVTFDAVLTKPMRASDLHDRLMELFGVRHEPRARRPRRSTETPLGRLHPLRILVAEDNPVNQKVAQLMFLKLGYRVTTVANGREAIEQVLQRPYDAVFMDVQMPEVDGLQATREIQTRLGSDAPRIVAMTAHAMEGDRQRCIDAGMADYVTKPVREHELAKALERCAGVGASDSVLPESVRAEEPPPPAEAERGAVDPEAVERLRGLFGNKPGRFSELIESTRGTAASLVETIRTAVAEADAAAVRDAAHSLKSSAGNFGAPLADLAEQIERAAAERDRDLARFLEQLYTEHQAFEQALGDVDAARKD